MRITRPGGCVAFQEPDISTYKCFPAHPAWDCLLHAIAEVFARIGGDVRLGQRLYPLAFGLYAFAVQVDCHVVGTHVKAYGVPPGSPDEGLGEDVLTRVLLHMVEPPRPVDLAGQPLSSHRAVQTMENLIGTLHYFLDLSP